MPGSPCSATNRHVPPASAWTDFASAADSCRRPTKALVLPAISARLYSQGKASGSEVYP